MLVEYLDLTNQFNESGQATLNPCVVIDISNYDYCLVQIENPSVTPIAFSASLDSRAILGVSDGNATTVGNGYLPSLTNFAQIAGVDLATDNLINELNGDGTIKFNVIGKYLAITNGSGQSLSSYLDKLLVMLAKIS
jgi:hypothetical protein